VGTCGVGLEKLGVRVITHPKSSPVTNLPRRTQGSALDTGQGTSKPLGSHLQNSFLAVKGMNYSSSDVDWEG
jgi:hypothetical protein